MHAHMSTLHIEMWDVIIDNLIQIMKANTSFILDPEYWVVYSEAQDRMDFRGSNQE